ncbi:hypothetical protein Cni_G02478 [Canna indica]|uniref:Malectin domain-containing protein n=1 Tax=Canna indica TaxID=4628 RepID=A0AAQ3JQ50_9LILI|nr:hypothetical protein Cni_G02478 [Canna indica]
MGTTFDEDTELLGGAGFHVNSRRHWVVSNVASNNLNDTDIVNISNSNLNEPEPQIYLTARTSTSSLRYFVVDLKNGNYTVKLHFTDIEMDSSRPSWTGLRRRIFDIYIQNILEVSNFNILNEAKGSKPVIKEFNVSVTSGIVDVHLFWRGKGTCCIPVEGTYGPLLSAIQVFPVVTSEKPARNHRRRNGIIVGIAAISAAGIIILSSVGYLWWKRIDLSRTHVDANMP